MQEGEEDGFKEVQRRRGNKKTHHNLTQLQPNKGEQINKRYGILLVEEETREVQKETLDIQPSSLRDNNSAKRKAEEVIMENEVMEQPEE